MEAFQLHDNSKPFTRSVENDVWVKQILEQTSLLPDLSNNLPKSLMKERRRLHAQHIGNTIFNFSHVLCTTVETDGIQEQVNEIANGIVENLKLMTESYKDMTSFLAMQAKCKLSLPYNKYNLRTLEQGGTLAFKLLRLGNHENYKPVTVWFCDPSGQLHEGVFEVIKLGNYSPMFVLRYFNKLTNQALVIPTSFLTHAVPASK